MEDYQLGKDASFEEGLVKEWRKYLPGGRKHHLWLAYIHDVPWPEDRSDITVVKT